MFCCNEEYIGVIYLKAYVGYGCHNERIKVKLPHILPSCTGNKEVSY